VIQDVTVSKVLIEGSTAVGVEYLEGNSTEPEILLAAKEVILSAGAFGSSKILMVRPLTCLPFSSWQQWGTYSVE
jgi:choline dehydrogenase-like flavoprotein